MFNHKNFATEGLFPGIVTHRSVANLGIYEVDIIITPIPPLPYIGGGGSGGTIAGNIAYAPYRVKNKILLRIKYNDRVWEKEYEDSSDIDFLNESKEVLVNFIKQKQMEAKVIFLGSMINIDNTIIKVTKL